MQQAEDVTLRAVFAAAVASAQPSRVIAQHLPEKPRGRCVVVGAGKASAAMAAALEAAWPDIELTGLVITRYGHKVPTRRVEIVEAAHPVPDEAGLKATARMMQLVAGLGADDLVIALISGGGSSLLTAPVEGVSLAEKQSLNRALLASGATISEMNTVRKRLSRVKGGGLARAATPARVVTLVISDVPGDDPAVIASGPTIPDDAPPETALEIIARYGIEIPTSVLAAISRPPPFTPAVSPPDVRLVASPALALEAAATEARRRGYTPLILGDALEGEAREIGIMMAGIARSVARFGKPVPKPAILLSGGECTVTLGRQKGGRGGRNLEFLLGFGVGAAGHPGIHALAGDSDGLDGIGDAAGAIVRPDTLQRGQALGLSAHAFLNAHDVYTYF
jgi:hydroxypyruvate reductase